MYILYSPWKCGSVHVCELQKTFRFYYLSPKKGNFAVVISPFSFCLRLQIVQLLNAVLQTPQQAGSMIETMATRQPEITSLKWTALWMDGIFCRAAKLGRGLWKDKHERTQVMFCGFLTYSSQSFLETQTAEFNSKQQKTCSFIC